MLKLCKYQRHISLCKLCIKPRTWLCQIKRYEILEDSSTRPGGLYFLKFYVLITFFGNFHIFEWKRNSYSRNGKIENLFDFHQTFLGSTLFFSIWPPKKILYNSQKGYLNTKSNKIWLSLVTWREFCFFKYQYVHSKINMHNQCKEV